MSWRLTPGIREQTPDVQAFVLELIHACSSACFAWRLPALASEARRGHSRVAGMLETILRASRSASRADGNASAAGTSSPRDAALDTDTSRQGAPVRNTQSMASTIARCGFAFRAARPRRWWQQTLELRALLVSQLDQPLHCQDGTHSLFDGKSVRTKNIPIRTIGLGLGL